MVYPIIRLNYITNQHRLDFYTTDTYGAQLALELPEKYIGYAYYVLVLLFRLQYATGYEDGYNDAIDDIGEWKEEIK